MVYEDASASRAEVKHIRRPNDRGLVEEPKTVEGVSNLQTGTAVRSLAPLLSADGSDGAREVGVLFVSFAAIPCFVASVLSRSVDGLRRLGKERSLKNRTVETMWQWPALRLCF